MPQPFLHAGQNGLVVAGLDIDCAGRRQSGLRQRRREQVWPRDAPQHLALGPRRHASREERGRSAVDCAIAASRHFVESAERQPAAGKAGVEIDDSEGKHRFGAAAVAFKAGDPLSKFGHGQMASGRAHIRLKRSQVEVCSMFVFIAGRVNESRGPRAIRPLSLGV